MPNATKNYLHIPHKDWAPDDPRESENYREIERWARGVPFTSDQTRIGVVPGNQTAASNTQTPINYGTASGWDTSGGQITQPTATTWRLIPASRYFITMQLRLSVPNTLTSTIFFNLFFSASNALGSFAPQAVFEYNSDIGGNVFGAWINVSGNYLSGGNDTLTPTIQLNATTPALSVTLTNGYMAVSYIGT